MSRIERKDLLAKFQSMKKDGIPIIGGGPASACPPNVRKPAVSILLSYIILVAIAWRAGVLYLEC